jgi:hypothetical protein
MLPWLRLKDQVSLGNVDFIPWRMEDGVTETPFVSESTVMKIMSSYVDIEGSPIERATIALHNATDVTGAINDQQKDEIVATARCLAFASIADNDYFCQIGQYVNAACFTVIFQRISNEGIVLTIRRRAGSLLAAHSMVKFSVPIQCQHIDDVRLNDDVIKAITSVLSNEIPLKTALLNAIRCFTLAYTDDNFLHLDQEVILLNTSYEYLFNAHGADHLAREVSNLLDRYGAITAGESMKMTKRLPPKRAEMWLHNAWVRECHVLRSKYVHGNKIDDKNMTWSPYEHVVFASWLFPFLVKLLMKDEGLYQLSRRDLDSLNAVDYLLDTSDWAGGPRNKTNWQSAMERGQGKALRREIVDHIGEYDIISGDDT